MGDNRKIKTLLTSAGMLMEDASAKVIIGETDVAASIKLLRDVSHDIAIISNVVEIIDRFGRLPGIGDL